MNNPSSPDAARGAPPVEFDAEQFKLVMRNVASSVTVITTEHRGSKHGMTATAVCSVSASPPTILIVVNQSTRSHPIIASARTFTVNILAEHQAEIGRRFSGKHDTPFDSVPHRLARRAGPILENALAHLECQIESQIEVGSHTIFVGTVLHGEVAASRPLLYHDGKYTSLVASNLRE